MHPSYIATTVDSENCGHTTTRHTHTLSPLAHAWHTGCHKHLHRRDSKDHFLPPAYRTIDMTTTRARVHSLEVRHARNAVGDGSSQLVAMQISTQHGIIRHQLIYEMHVLALQPPVLEPNASDPPIEPPRTPKIVATPPLARAHTSIGVTPNIICYHPHTGPWAWTTTTITNRSRSFAMLEMLFGMVPVNLL